MSDEDKANSVHDQATADGADFDKIAKENTTAKKTEYTFDSADTKLPTDVMNAAFKQDEGSVSDVIKVMNSSTYSYTYYIVKTTKKTEKLDWKTYKKRLKKAIMAKYQNDTNFQNQVIAKALDKANVKIKDSSFASILSQYATSSSSSSSASSSKASSTSSEASSSSSTEESSTTESSTDSAE